MALLDEVLEVIENMSLDEQETLAEIVQEMIIEHRRVIMAREIEKAQEEYLSGNFKAASIFDIIHGITL